MTDQVRIRVARLADITAMQDVERDAGTLFAAIGMQDVADEDPAPFSVLERYVIDARAWVAEVSETVVGYALVDVVDDTAHLEQLSVRPAFGRRGIGRTLVRTVAGWAREREFGTLTLRTFRDVPWNAPYYASLGFQQLDDGEVGPGLRALREHERELGLAVDARCAMRLEIETSSQ
jgi:GNAT superfamily N-acetyltransferase